MQNNVNIQNKRARFEYEILDKYIAGIVLKGTEIKSIRLGKASIAESFCEFNEKSELFVINMTIEEYAWGTYYNHKTKEKRTQETAQGSEKHRAYYCPFTCFP